MRSSCALPSLNTANLSPHSRRLPPPPRPCHRTQPPSPSRSTTTPRPRHFHLSLVLLAPHQASAHPRDPRRASRALGSRFRRARRILLRSRRRRLPARLDLERTLPLPLETHPLPSLAAPHSTPLFLLIFHLLCRPSSDSYPPPRVPKSPEHPSARRQDPQREHARRPRTAEREEDRSWETGGEGPYGAGEEGEERQVYPARGGGG